MGILKRHFPFGLGTSRFPISGPGDAKGIEASVKLVLRALEAGEMCIRDRRWIHNDVQFGCKKAGKNF